MRKVGRLNAGGKILANVKAYFVNIGGIQGEIRVHRAVHGSWKSFMGRLAFGQLHVSVSNNSCERVLTLRRNALNKPQAPAAAAKVA